MPVNPGSAMLRIRFVVASWKEDTRTDVELLRRFVQTRDDQAFTTLVGRHSELVWGVCLRILRNHADAEDAVQATFLRLARDAGRILKREALAGWLLRAARDCAVDLQRTILRQRRLEERLAECVAERSGDTPPTDLRVLLDDELAQLPESYRTILILCCLQGRTYAEVALELGCSTAAVHRRLVRAQTLLRRRFAKRGVAATTLLAVVFLGTSLPAASAAPPVLLARAVETGLALARDGLLPASRAGELAAHATGSAVKGLKVSGFAATVAALAILVASLSAALLSKSEPERRVEVPLAAVPVQTELAKPPTAIAGVVRGPDGAPVAGADVVAMARRPFGPAERGLRDEVLVATTTNVTGQFTLLVPNDFDTWFTGRVVTLHASRADFAPATLPVRLKPTSESVELKLLTASPLCGTLRDENGRPAAGVRVEVVRVGDAVAEPVVGGRQANLPATWPPAVTTSADGGFVLPNLGGSANVWVRVNDQRFSLETFRVDVAKPDAAREFKLDPAVPLAVEVQAADTGLAIPGARVTIITDSVPAHPHFCVTEHGILSPRALPADIDAITDERGRVQVSLSRKDTVDILVHPSNSVGPYVGVRTRVEIGKETGNRPVVVRAQRGRWVSGTVTDAVTGRPIAGAAVHWGRERATRPEWRDSVLVGRDALTRTAADGTFRLAVLPGACSIRVYGPTLDFPAVPLKLPNNPNVALFAHDITRLEVPERGEVPRVNVSLRAGHSVAGRIEQPKRGVPYVLCSGRVSPVRGYASLPLPASDGEFTVPGCRAGYVTRAHFLDPVARVGGVSDVTPGVPAPAVSLTECGRIRFRVVDEAGRPRAAQDVAVSLLLDRDRAVNDPGLAEPIHDSQPVEWFDSVNYPARPKSNAEGLVELLALIPGARYSVAVGAGTSRLAVGCFAIETGKTVTLPDVILPVQPAPALVPGPEGGSR